MPFFNQPSAQDAYGHYPPIAGQALTAGAVSTTAAGTIAPTTGAGATPTVTVPNAVDFAGSFVLNPVTGGGAQAAGAVALVTFANPLPSIPKAILVNIYDQANGAAVAAAAGTITTSSFQVLVGVALTTAHNYLVSYEVIC
jgi:hypothetical protein